MPQKRREIILAVHETSRERARGFQRLRVCEGENFIVGRSKHKLTLCSMGKKVVTLEVHVILFSRHQWRIHNRFELHLRRLCD